MTLPLIDRLAFYGKLPCAGDFIARNIEYAESQRIDAWLASEFSTYKASNPLWLDGYLISPVWKFVLPPGLWLDEPVIGALMPSVDRVGRYFPFVFFARLPKSILSKDGQQEFRNYFTYATQIVKALPELLGCEIPIDKIIPFVDQTQQLDDSCFEGFEWEFLQSQIIDGKSYWWCFNEQVEQKFYCLAGENADLFLRLFNQSDNDENKKC